MSNNDIKPYKNQVWKELIEEHSSDCLFEDPEFPADESSLYYSKDPPINVTWKRPYEVFDNPKFVVNGFNRNDLDQGILGDCWFIGASAGILQSKKCFAKVVPRDQDFDDNYAGIFHFRFWQYGEWVDVVVDDRLPFSDDNYLIFCSNKEEPNEMWGPLLEKAYAKLHGSYEALHMGYSTEAMIDMSGGIEEKFYLKDKSIENQDFWYFLSEAFKKKSIMSCNISGNLNELESKTSNGLVKQHVYTITNVCEIDLNNDDTCQLIRLRNPWGNSFEWKGAWSDNSPEWKLVDENIKRDLGMVKDHDGEFWMSYDDFLKNWDILRICHLSADNFAAELLQNDDDSDLYWKCFTFHGEWKPGINAGGAHSYKTPKYWTNPQFTLPLIDADYNDNENMATAIIALMQKDSRLKRTLTGKDSEEQINFCLFKINDGVNYHGKRLNLNQVSYIGQSGNHVSYREVTKRFRLKPGHYLIIPSTYNEDKNCSFMLRIFTKQAINNN